MPSYIITFKSGAPEAEKQKTKEKITGQGGTIGHEYTLINGFSCTIPEGTITTLESEPHIEGIEPDQVMRTQ